MKRFKLIIMVVCVMGLCLGLYSGVQAATISGPVGVNGVYTNNDPEVLDPLAAPITIYGWASFGSDLGDTHIFIGLSDVDAGIFAGMGPYIAFRKNGDGTYSAAIQSGKESYGETMSNYLFSHKSLADLGLDSAYFRFVFTIDFGADLATVSLLGVTPPYNTGSETPISPTAFQIGTGGYNGFTNGGNLAASAYNSQGVDYLASTTPEPGSLLLLGSGLFGLAALRRRRRRKLGL